MTKLNINFHRGNPSTEHRLHHINHFINSLSQLAQAGLENTLRLSHTFMQIQESIQRYESDMRREIQISSIRIDLMDNLVENITFNNEDIQEIMSWYQKSSKFYDAKVELARKDLVAHVQAFSTDDESGDMTIGNILYAIRTSAEKLRRVKFSLRNGLLIG